MNSLLYYIYNKFFKEKKSKEIQIQEIKQDEPSLCLLEYEEECGICLIEITDINNLKVLKCSHQLCITCFNNIKNHFYSKNVEIFCPFCRAKI